MFKERDPLPKTRRWDVINIRTQEVAGEIQWYGGFRKYVFFPEDDCFFDHDCLELIAGFLKVQMQTYRESKGKKYHYTAPEYANVGGRIERVK